MRQGLQAEAEHLRVMHCGRGGTKRERRGSHVIMRRRYDTSHRCTTEGQKIKALRCDCNNHTTTNHSATHQTAIPFSFLNLPAPLKPLNLNQKTVQTKTFRSLLPPSLLQPIPSRFFVACGSVFCVTITRAVLLSPHPPRNHQHKQRPRQQQHAAAAAAQQRAAHRPAAGRERLVRSRSQPPAVTRGSRCECFARMVLGK